MQLYGFRGLSVFAEAGMTAAELVASVPELGPDRCRQVRTSTVGRLRSAGFPLVPTQDHPHYDVVLADLTEPTLDRLQTCFDPARSSRARPRTTSAWSATPRLPSGRFWRTRLVGRDPGLPQRPIEVGWVEAYEASDLVHGCGHPPRIGPGAANCRSWFVMVE